MSITCSDFSIYICSTLESHGYEAYIVGGYVRDALLNRTCGDIDITTNASPDTIESLFPHTVPTGKAFGTITVVNDQTKETIEVTTFRSESGYSNARHPDVVTYGCSLIEDLLRRDFTINAMAYQCHSQKLTDIFGGQVDLDQKVIRTVGSASQRFMEDSLRLFRACRFASQLGFSVESNTKQAIINLGYSIPLPSMERIHSELNLTIQSRYPDIGFRLLQEAGVLRRLGLEISEDVFSRLRECPVSLRWAFLFFKLENVELKMKTLRFSRSVIKDVLLLIENGLDPKKAQFTTKDLALSGSDIMALGYTGKEIGQLQIKLRKAVLDGHLENTPDALREYLTHPQSKSSN